MPRKDRESHKQYCKEYNERHEEDLKEYRKRYYRENKERIDDRNRWNHIRRTFKLSKEDYLTILEGQDGRCAICAQSSEGYLSVDHDRACCSGVNSCGSCVRGLLCKSCNTGIAMFKDNAESLGAAIGYIEKWKPA